MRTKTRIRTIAVGGHHFCLMEGMDVLGRTNDFLESSFPPDLLLFRLPLLLQPLLDLILLCFVNLTFSRMRFFTSLNLSLCSSFSRFSLLFMDRKMSLLDLSSSTPGLSSSSNCSSQSISSSSRVAEKPQ